LIVVAGKAGRTMRSVSYVFWGMSVLAAFGWLGFYVWINGMASAFDTSGRSGIRWPWQLRGEDMLYLLVLPAAVVSLLVLLAVLAGRAAAR